MLDNVYVDVLSGEDIAQSESSFAKVLPMNLAMNLKVNTLMAVNANTVKYNNL
jgi:hypothetical protein